MPLVASMKQSLSYETEQFFPFLSLPFELRLKVYAFLLPSRTHTIVTQYPHNGYYYSETSMASHATQTLYPAQPDLSPTLPELHQKLTTYKLLNANFHHDFPNPSIFSEILRTCKQIRNEAEPVMYGAETAFDFGVYVDAVVPFLKDRSALARRAIRHISIAREVPVMSRLADSGDGRPWDSNQAGEEVVDVLWSTTSVFLRDQCVGLRTMNLTVWAENGGLIEETLPTAKGSTPSEQDVEESLTYRAVEIGNDNKKGLHAEEEGKFWRQWEWTRALLKVEALKHVKVTWWRFAASKTREAKFDGWLGRRMVADNLVRDRMVHEGHIVEGITLVPGGWYTKLVDI